MRQQEADHELADVAPLQPPVPYAGFWIRLGASLIDTLLISLITWPILFLVYGDTLLQPSAPAVLGPAHVVISYLLPTLAVLIFWKYRSATPGKILLALRIRDVGGGDPTTAQLVIRYFAYLLSALPLLLGFVWVMWDKRKQAWHDKLSRTVVVKDRRF